MPSNDIIDNRDQKLADHINCILGSTQAAKFAVGYFFLSGLEAVAGKLAGVSNLRILIGNTSNRETIEQIAEGYQRLELAAAGEDAQRLLYESDIYDDSGLIDALEKCSRRYQLEDFNEQLLREHLEADRKLLKKMIKLVEPISPQQDAKLQVLLAGLSDGIRSARGVFSGAGKFVFCQAGKYQQLYLTDADGNPETREVPAVLGKLKCSRTEATALLPTGHNGTMMKVLKAFESEVKHLCVAKTPSGNRTKQLGRAPGGERML